MAETAETVIKDALTEIVVLGAEAPLEAADAQVAIRYLNRMMTALDADGVTLGYTEVSTLKDQITVASGAIEGMVFNLALKLWTQYSDGQPPPGELMLKAREGLKTMRMIGVSIGVTEFPATLPIGSGNETYSTRDSHFYPDLQDTILAETNGSISLEDSTE
jgi:P22 tail accessory factor.